VRENPSLPNSVLTTGQRVPHISHVFREMWETTAANLQFLALQRLPSEIRVPRLAKNVRDTPNFLYVALDKVACAPLYEGRRINYAEPNELNRKSGIWPTHCPW
jgi:hypothetical protein